MDNKQKASSSEKGNININDDAELRDWSDRLNVTKVKLKAAVNAAGPAAKAVEAYLNKQHQR
jgi:hypothetical protein